MTKDFSSAINEIMPLVKDGDSSTPFIITRDSAYKDWQVCYPYPAENADSFFNSQKQYDPYAVMFAGADFSKGSYSYVYDSIFCARMEAELEHNIESGMYDGNSLEAFFEGMDENEARALYHFFDDNIGEFSQKTTDYLATLETPLFELAELCGLNMETDNADWRYNEDLAHEAITLIEHAVDNRLYGQREKITLTPEHCLKNTNDKDFTGHLLIVKADALMPEYRDSESQIVKCTHGNGARPNAKGISIFCNELSSSKTVVYYRNEIEGIADIEKLPSWAKRKLAEHDAEQSTQKPAMPDKKPSLQEKLDSAKEKARGAEQKADSAGKGKPIKSNKMEVG